MKRIAKEHKQNPSIIKTNKFYKKYKDFKLPKADAAKINTIAKCLNNKKATGADNILPKLAANVTDVVHIINIMNEDISIKTIQGTAKLANIFPICKKEAREDLKIYRN